MLNDFLAEYERYKALGEKALAQIPDAALNQPLRGELNSPAMIVRHVGGNLRSRFTDFLTTDGEKPWRDRDAEFETRDYTRAEVAAWWAAGWTVLFEELGTLTEADLSREVTIRGLALTVHAALCRSLAHTALHVGQLILLARLLHEGEWQSLSIPKGQSRQYNQQPTLEKRFS
jgi:hypothetical protein